MIGDSSSGIGVFTKIDFGVGKNMRMKFEGEMWKIFVTMKD